MIVYRLPHRRRGARLLGARAGLTIVEAIGMTIIIGLLAGLAYPAIYGLRESGMDQRAIGVAQALNQAQQTYLLRVASAESNWEGATDSASKYLLISQYVPFAAADLGSYEPSGYSIALGGTLSTKATITGPNGTSVSY